MILEAVVEEVIVLDRCVTLLEEGCARVYKVPLFDERVSPRCFAIVASKDSCED